MLEEGGIWRHEESVAWEESANVAGANEEQLRGEKFGLFVVLPRPARLQQPLELP